MKTYQGDGGVLRESSMNLKRSRKVSLDGEVPEVNLKGLRALSGKNEKG